MAVLGKKKWVVFFSRTGSEVKLLSKSYVGLGREPDLVITNRKSLKGTPHEDYYKQLNVRYIPENPTLSDYIGVLKDMNPDNTVITLHGWLRIIPPKICDIFEIYNGHPGLITKYPELKGKDPVERLLDNLSDYSSFGAVIHQVTAKVDGGEIVIVRERALTLPAHSESMEVYVKDTIPLLSLYTWISFFRKYPDFEF
jgi:folate-dependent phosphoribosylglycinamide formyltransferase PurN